MDDGVTLTVSEVVIAAAAGVPSVCYEEWNHHASCSLADVPHACRVAAVAREYGPGPLVDRPQMSPAGPGPSPPSSSAGMHPQHRTRTTAWSPGPQKPAPGSTREDTMPITATGPAYSGEALAAVEKAALPLRSLCAPSVLEQAAALLTDLWAAGERHDVQRKEWDWAVNLPSGALEVIASRYTHAPDPERTGEQVTALCQDLVEALTSDEIGLSVRPGSRKNIAIVERLPQTPRGGRHGDATLVVGIYSNRGWDISMNADGATVVSIAAPATTAGAAEVAAIVRAVARGELGNPFR